MQTIGRLLASTNSKAKLTKFLTDSWKPVKKRELQIRLIDISKLGTALGTEVCAALVGARVWTGCDSITSFAGKGKIKAVDLIRKNEQFRDTFVLLGQQVVCFR